VGQLARDCGVLTRLCISLETSQKRQKIKRSETG
jgi:hypothetical protein